MIQVGDERRSYVIYNYDENDKYIGKDSLVFIEEKDVKCIKEKE